MSGEFDVVDDDQGLELPDYQATAKLFSKDSAGSAIEGLQACIQTSILVQCEDDNTFRCEFQT